MEIITCKEAKENHVRCYEVHVETLESLMKQATICCKEDLQPMVVIEGLYKEQLFGKIIFVDERTNLIYDAIVYDNHASNYIYMINTDTCNIEQNYIGIYEARD